jgi:hypothetical protein
MPAPKIDDQYWFDMSERLVSSAREARDIAAQKLQTFAGWAWTAFIAATAFGTGIGKTGLSEWQAVFVALTGGLLVVLYWTAGWAQIPDMLQFDPRSPDEIKAAYQQDIRQRVSRLRIAMFIAFVATALIAVSFVLVALGEKCPAK